LNEEENATVKRINQLHEHEKKEKQRITEELEPGQKKLQVRKTVLSQEVDFLESRKKEALKPIDDIKLEAEKILKENLEYQKLLINREKKIESREENLIEKEEDVIDRLKEVENEEINLNVREKGIKSAKEEIKRSSEELAKKWVAYHEAVHALNMETKNIERAKKEIEDARLVNENFKKSLDKKEIEQVEHDRQISDRYSTLSRAIDEAKKNHGII